MPLAWSGPQKKIAKTIIGKDADHILALKENHKTLYDETVLFFDKMESTREVKGECSHEKRYYISSLECD